ncbi:MAG: hypothetical protein N3E51_04680 [Candidatus Micrarchaeota archaeon]|nr:hypothetical protein [Candidatus Micrarchaeota archaeon]
MELLSTFQLFRTILCICPHCNGIYRLSDLHLRAGGRPAKTWLDVLEEKSLRLDKKEELFEEKERKLREAAAERGRKKAASIIRDLMIPSLSRFKFDPYDIKLITHPIEFVVFDGMNAGELDRIILLSAKAKSPTLLSLHKQIEIAVREKNYDWRVARFSSGRIAYE